MIEVKCPRCEQFWYCNDDDQGRIRLCDKCVEELKRLRPGQRTRIDAFMIAAAVFLLIDGTLILLTRFWPDDFGKVTLIYGLVLFAGGMSGLRRVAGVGHAGDADWTLGRWPLMIALMGAACMLAYVSFVVLRK